MRTNLTFCTNISLHEKPNAWTISLNSTATTFKSRMTKRRQLPLSVITWWKSWSRWPLGILMWSSVLCNFPPPFARLFWSVSVFTVLRHEMNKLGTISLSRDEMYVEHAASAAVVQHDTEHHLSPSSMCVDCSKYSKSAGSSLTETLPMVILTAFNPITSLSGKRISISVCLENKETLRSFNKCGIDTPTNEWNWVQKLPCGTYLKTWYKKQRQQKNNTEKSKIYRDPLPKPWHSPCFHMFNKYLQLLLLLYWRLLEVGKGWRAEPFA